MDNRYKIKKSLGKGGMGEVFLAYDTIAKRLVALKKIRSDLAKKEIVIKRFLREAKIASILSHPSIVPIYDIHLKEPYYYTMPYVEGKTLKEKIADAKKDENTSSSMAGMIRIFLTVCEAIAYIHSKNILHRDLKPDNIIIGKYGEVLLLDWGIAKFLNEDEIDENLEFQKEDLELTQIGKVAGTLSYMAPKRALGHKATSLTDIYSLGAILYHILTLELPFRRRDLKTFRKNVHLEKILDPIEKTPKRDIPKKLSDICMKCLAEEDFRYKNVEDIIVDLKEYIEGKPEWVLTSDLDLNKSEDWQFKENILLTENTAISPITDFAQWITLMVSKLSFATNLKIEADITLNKWSNGIGFFLNILKSQNSFKIEDGYKLWINLNKKESEISRSNVLIFEDRIDIKPDEKHHLIIEKVDDKLNVYLDKKLIFSHINHLPIRGSFFAIGYRDTSFMIDNLKIYTSTYNVMVNCLAIADAFFAKEDYDTAIKEYEKITFSFPSRKEGLEATFRAGISYLEKAKKIKNFKIKQKYLDLSLEEFQKLHSSTFEPLEYLGKSLVYLEKLDFIEEAKCLELMIRKFSTHHQSSILNQYIIYRMHQSSYQDREATYRIALISLRFIPNLLENISSKKLLDRLEKHLEKFYFIENSNNLIHNLSIKLSFILNKKSSLIEILNSNDLNEIDLENAIFSLLELEDIKKAEYFIEKHKEKLNQKSYKLLKHLLSESFENEIDLLLKTIEKKPSTKEIRVLIYLLEKVLDEKKYKKVIDVFEKIKKLTIEKNQKVLLDSIIAKAYLIEDKVKSASKLFDKYIKNISEENFPLHFLYGLYLHKHKGAKAASSYFSNLLDIAHPKSFAISSHFISNSSHNFLKKAFYFEKRRLLKDLLLYSLVLNDKKILKLSQKVFINLH